MSSGAKEPSPGLDPRRLVRLMREAVERCRLNLSGATVLTEAATGAYAVTPVLAALAGASRVYALTRATPYGSVEDVAVGTRQLARLAGVGRHVEVVTERSRALVARADVVTNSGHVRPIDAEMVGWMKPGAVLPLMYEAWEFREGDVDLAACRARGIAVAGTHERHPHIDVFGFLGLMAVTLLADAGVSAYRGRILLCCDNRFRPYLEQGLVAAGAEVRTVVQLRQAAPGPCDAVLVAMRPQPQPVLDARDAAWLAKHQPGTPVAQYWGDLDRAALAAEGVPVWPPDPPARGHMGILPSGVGPEPIVRLQAGGLKVAEVLRRPPEARRPQDLEYVQWL
ncbi:MAG: hypothetical protein ACE147_17685 [Candidatus Methylomirabilales bacterium]